MSQVLVLDDGALASKRRLARQTLGTERACPKRGEPERGPRPPSQPDLRAGRELGGIVGRNARLTEALTLAAEAADQDGPVLLIGERGTGKALLARALHASSRRADRPFVALAGRAALAALRDSERFGPAQDATRDAHDPRADRFAAANGGTIYLGEIADLDPDGQSELLHVLEGHSAEARDASATRSLDVRIIAATRQNLFERVAEGRFRADLFERLNGRRIEIPPLRERLDDLPLLVDSFLERARGERGSRVCGLSTEALERLLAHPWPGNVRELENLIEGLTLQIGEGEIDLCDLPEALLTEPGRESYAPRLPSTGLDFNDVVTRFENDLIEQALDRTGWNKNRAAKLLGLNRTTLLEKIKKRGLVRRPAPR